MIHGLADREVPLSPYFPRHRSLGTPAAIGRVLQPHQTRTLQRVHCLNNSASDNDHFTTYASEFDASEAYANAELAKLCTCGEITAPQATQPSRFASTISQCHRIDSSFSADGLPQSLSEATEGRGLPPVWMVPGSPVTIGVQRTSIRHGGPEVDLQAGE